MTPRDIIARAWALTLQHSSLRRWSFVESFLQTSLDIVLIVCQSTFLITYLRTGQVIGFFDIGRTLYNALPGWFFIFVLVAFCLLFICEFILPHLCRGAVIGLAAKAHLHEPVKGGLVLALYNFFPLFVLHGFIFLASWTTVVSAISLILRYVDDPMRTIFVGFFLFFFLLSNLIRCAVCFAPQAIVVRKMGVFGAIARSMKLLLSNASHVMFLVLLLVVISVRILINAALVIILPALMVAFGVFLSLFLSTTVSTIIAVSVGIILLIVLSYFFTYLYAFKMAVWTIAFLELDSQKDQDLIG